MPGKGLDAQSTAFLRTPGIRRVVLGRRRSAARRRASISGSQPGHRRGRGLDVQIVVIGRERPEALELDQLGLRAAAGSAAARSIAVLWEPRRSEPRSPRTRVATPVAPRRLEVRLSTPTSHAAPRRPRRLHLPVEAGRAGRARLELDRHVAGDSGASTGPASLPSALHLTGRATIVSSPLTAGGSFVCRARRWSAERDLGVGARVEELLAEHVGAELLGLADRDRLDPGRSSQVDPILARAQRRAHVVERASVACEMPLSRPRPERGIDPVLVTVPSIVSFRWGSSLAFRSRWMRLWSQPALYSTPFRSLRRSPRPLFFEAWKTSTATSSRLPLGVLLSHLDGGRWGRYRRSSSPSPRRAALRRPRAGRGDRHLLAGVPRRPLGLDYSNLATITGGSPTGT